MDVNWWASSLLDEFLPSIRPEARNVLTSCLLQPTDELASAILLISTVPRTQTHRRRGLKRQKDTFGVDAGSCGDDEYDSYASDGAAGSDDGFGGDAVSDCDMSDGVLSDNDISEDEAPAPTSGVDATLSPRNAQTVVIPQHLLAQHRWNVDLEGPSEGDCALITLHSLLASGYMRFDATSEDASFVVRVAMGPLSSSLAAIFSVPSTHYADMRDVASLHQRQVPPGVLRRGNEVGAS